MVFWGRQPGPVRNRILSAGTLKHLESPQTILANPSMWPVNVPTTLSCFNVPFFLRDLDRRHHHHHHHRQNTEVAEVERQLRILKEEGKVDKEPIGKPHNGWFILENPIKMDDLWGYHYFRKHPSTYTFNCLFLILHGLITIQGGPLPLMFYAPIFCQLQDMNRRDVERDLSLIEPTPWELFWKTMVCGSCGSSSSIIGGTCGKYMKILVIIGR